MSYEMATAEAPHLQLRALLLPQELLSQCKSHHQGLYPQLHHLEGIQVCLIKGSGYTLLDYTGFKRNFAFSSLLDLFLDSMAYFHNPAVILQNLYPKKASGHANKKMINLQQ